MSNARCTECGVVDWKGVIVHSGNCSQRKRTRAEVARDEIMANNERIRQEAEANVEAKKRAEKLDLDEELDDHFYDAKSMTLEDYNGSMPGKVLVGDEVQEFFGERVNEREYWSTLQVSAMLGCVAFGACLALGVMYSARVGLL